MRARQTCMAGDAGHCPDRCTPALCCSSRQQQGHVPGLWVLHAMQYSDMSCSVPVIRSFVQLDESVTVSSRWTPGAACKPFCRTLPPRGQVLSHVRCCIVPCSSSPPVEGCSTAPAGACCSVPPACLPTSTATLKKWRCTWNRRSLW